MSEKLNTMKPSMDLANPNNGRIFYGISLPNEVLEKIFKSILSITDLKNASRCCKLWCLIIKDHKIIQFAFDKLGE